MNANKISGLFEGEAEDKSSFFTGFYVINEKYKSGLVPNDKISQIWSSAIKYSSIVKEFRYGFWCEKKIEFCNKVIRVMNIHISLSYELMLKLSLLEYAEQNKDEYIILLGDFNAAEEEDTEKFIEENDQFLKTLRKIGFVELGNEDVHYTHYASNKGRKIDHIYVSKKFHNDFDYTLDYIDEVNYGHPKYNESETAFTDHSAIKVKFTER